MSSIADKVKAELAEKKKKDPKAYNNVRDVVKTKSGKKNK